MARRPTLAGSLSEREAYAGERFSSAMALVMSPKRLAPWSVMTSLISKPPYWVVSAYACLIMLPPISGIFLTKREDS